MSEVASNNDANLNFFSRESSLWSQPELRVTCVLSWENWRLDRFTSVCPVFESFMRQLPEVQRGSTVFPKPPAPALAWRIPVIKGC